MRLYRVVEASDGVFRGQLWVPNTLLDRLKAALKGRSIGMGDWVTCTSQFYGNPNGVSLAIAEYEAVRRKEEFDRRTFPREISWGHVADDGFYHQLRQD